MQKTSTYHTDLTVIAWYLQCLWPVLSNNFSWWPYCVTLLPIISPTFLYTFIREQVNWHKTHFTDTPLKRVQPSYIFDIILQGTYCTLQPVMTIKALQANDSFAWRHLPYSPLNDSTLGGVIMAHLSISMTYNCQGREYCYSCEVLYLISTYTVCIDLVL